MLNGNHVIYSIQG